MSVSYGGDSITFADGSVQSGGWIGMKNRIINGAMTIDQRYAGTSVTPGATFSYQLDRWSYGTSVASKISVQQVADAPAGFYNSVKLTSLSAYTITSSNRFIFSQIVEGSNTSDLNWGTSNASTLTLSFWVKSSLTGTFACSFNNFDGSRSYVTTYTINQANTWEKETIIIPGPTSGSFQNGTNSGSIYVNFDLGSGSTYTTSTLNTWQNAFYENATGAVALPSTNGATWQVTGVQLEKGSTASSFEYRPNGTELSLCQRYYAKSYNHDVIPGTATTVGLEVCGWQGAGGAGGAYGNVKFPVKMRGAPNTISIWDGAGTATTTASYTYGGGGSGQSIANGGAWWGSGTPFNTSHSGFFMRPTSQQPNALTYCHYAADAEL